MSPSSILSLSRSSYLEPNGQVAVNQAIYMLMRRGAELEVAGKHILQREGRGEGTRGGEAEAGEAPPSSTATARLASSPWGLAPHSRPSL